MNFQQTANRRFVGILLIAVGCSSAPSDPPKPKAKGQDSHQRMLDLLAKIKTEARYEKSFFGPASLEDDRAALKQAAPEDHFAQLLLHRRLGRRELFLGNPKAAVVHHLAAYRLLPRVRDSISDKTRQQITFDLAVAYLRLGENENCVKCNNGASCLLPIRREGIHTDQTGSRNAIKYLSQLLKQNPQHLSAVWLLNIAHMTVGEYPKAVPKKFLIPASRFESDEKFPRFVNIATAIGLDAVNCSGGSIVDDFDNDGFLDIVTSSWGAGDQILYFKNNGDGTFSDRTNAAGLTGLYGGLNLIQADYDNDGDLDVYVLRGAWMGKRGRIPNSLLRNDGKGNFRDVTFDVRLGESHHPSQTAAWADYDNDGDLDLYVGNETDASQLFENDGNGVFTDVAKRAGVQNGGVSKGVSWGDFDNDGNIDLYVSNLGSRNRLYRNNGAGTFTDVAGAAGVGKPMLSFATWFWDFDNDGALDLYVASYPMGVEHIAADYLQRPVNVEADKLYRGDGRGGFRDVAKEQNLRRVTQPMGSNFGDLDNDGFPDFYLGTGYPEYEGLMPNLMYRNRGGMGFSDVTTAGGFGHLQKGHGVSFADLDSDGDQDLFIELGGAFPGDRFGNALFQNPGFGNNWITIQLVGTKSNRSAIGARIRIETTQAKKKRTTHKWVNSGGSFGANPLRQEIGLAKADTIDRLEIRWPRTGETQTFTNVKVNQFIRIVEDSQKIEVLDRRKVVLKTE